MSIPKSMSTPMPELRFTITPIKLAGTQNGVMHSNGYSQNNGSPNPVAESPLVGLHQSLSTSNGVYPDTPIARALQKVNNKSSDSDQSTPSIINEIDGESESTSSKESNQLKKSTNEEQSTSVVITEVDDESVKVILVPTQLGFVNPKFAIGGFRILMLCLIESIQPALVV